MNTTEQPRRVVIVGGGFAGLAAAKSLNHRGFAVTLVDRAEHHLFQPLLYQCATGILSEGQIAAPLRDILKRRKHVECVLAEVIDVDAAGRRVLARRPGGDDIQLPYDDLIIAAGVNQSYFGHDEFARWAPGMKTIADALAIRRRLFGAFELAETATDPADRRRLLTFAVVGAGPTGVELAGQIRELATKTLAAEFRQISPEEAEVLLFDGGEAPLAGFGPTLSAKATESLHTLGVDLHMRTMVTHVDGDGLLARDQRGRVTRYEAGTVLWAAGVAAPPLAEALAKATQAPRDDSGRILVDPNLTVPGYPEISVVGDMMSLDDLPGMAEVAMQSGRYAARRIKRRAAGDENVAPFRYRDLGIAAYVSRGHAVVAIGRLRFDGLLGWFVWLFIHLAFLTGFRARVGAILTWSVAFTREARRERVFTVEEIDTSRNLYQRSLPDDATATSTHTPQPHDIPPRL